MSQLPLANSWTRKSPRINNSIFSNSSQIRPNNGTSHDTTRTDTDDTKQPEMKPSPSKQEQPADKSTTSNDEQKSTATTTTESATPTPPRQREAPQPAEVTVVPETDAETDTNDESSDKPQKSRLSKGVIISLVVVGMMVSLYCAAAGAITGDYRPDFNVVDTMTVTPGGRWKNWVFLTILTIAGIVCFSVPVRTRRVRLGVAILGALWAVGWYVYLRYGEVMNTFDYTAPPTTVKDWLVVAWPELKMASPLVTAYAALVSIASKEVCTPWTVRAGIPAVIFLLVSLALVLIEG